MHLALFRLPFIDHPEAIPFTSECLKSSKKLFSGSAKTAHSNKKSIKNKIETVDLTEDTPLKQIEENLKKIYFNLPNKFSKK
jgi:hypothetical protein